MLLWPHDTIVACIQVGFEPAWKQSASWNHYLWERELSRGSEHLVQHFLLGLRPRIYSSNACVRDIIQCAATADLFAHYDSAGTTQLSDVAARSQDRANAIRTQAVLNNCLASDNIDGDCPGYSISASYFWVAWQWRGPHWEAYSTP